MRPYSLLWEAQCDNSIISVAATPNCTTIAGATVGKTLYLFNSVGEALWPEPYKTNQEAWSTAISADGQFIAVGTANKNPADGSVFVLDRGRKPLWNARLKSPVWGVSLSPNGDRLAASTWGNNLLYLYERKGSSYCELARVEVPGNHGLYGVQLVDNGNQCWAASYDSGLYLIDSNGHVKEEIAWSDGLYNLAYAKHAKMLVVGSRRGAFLSVSLSGVPPVVAESQAISERPLCGVSVSENAGVIASGSFDGNIGVTNSAGEVLWKYQTKGEVWSTVMSSDGRLICAGSGDHRLRFFENYCDAASYQEIEIVEKALLEASGSATLSRLQTLTDLYLSKSLIDYGAQKLTSYCVEHAEHFESHVVKDCLKKFLETTVKRNKDVEEACFKYASLLAEEQSHKDAIKYFQKAAGNPSLRSLAYRRAAECFAELRLNTAAASAWRQSRAQHLDADTRHILFILARSYEDLREWSNSSKIYEMIVAWDSGFRNAWDRLEMAQTYLPGTSSELRHGLIDYTGATISLLGPDAPRELDESLKEVVSARNREVLISAGDRRQVQETVTDLLSDEIYSSGIRRDIGHLSYDAQLFIKYDFGLPEDEMKKFLETVNAFAYFVKYSNKASPTSLDIGSATGRYPTLLTRLKFKATGIDIEPQAIEHSKNKVKHVAWPRFIQGDALRLDTCLQDLEDPKTFDVITCMMGTFQHIPIAEQGTLINQMYGALNTAGVAIVSLWDIECPHLSYLSMYDENQKDRIRQNSMPREATAESFKSAGFSDVTTIPFSLLPQNVIYDLGIAGMQASDINIAAQADLASRALFSQRHGEMFLVIAFKS